MDDTDGVHVEQHAGGWALAGRDAAGFGLVKDYLGSLAHRRYSPRTIRACAFDLLHLVRWLLVECLRLEQVTTEVLLRYLAGCRAQALPGRPARRGDNVFSIRDGRNAGLAPATINRRLAAISGLFAYQALRDPVAASPVSSGRQARVAAVGSGAGCWGTWAGPRRARGCGSASLAGCPAAWTAPRSPRCFRACAVCGTGRSPG